jgi:hypothetical protein
MEDITEVRKALVDVFRKVQNKSMDIDQAKMLVTTANSIIHTAAIQLEHNKFTGSTAEIPFLTIPPKELEK